MIISTAAEKAFDRTQQSFMIKHTQASNGRKPFQHNKGHRVDPRVVWV